MPLSTSQVPGVTGVGTVQPGPPPSRIWNRQQLSLQLRLGLACPGWSGQRFPPACHPHTHLEGYPGCPGGREGLVWGLGSRGMPWGPQEPPRPGSPSCRPDTGRASSLRAAVPALGPRPLGRGGGFPSLGSAEMPWCLLVCRIQACGQGSRVKATVTSPSRGQAWVWPEESGLRDTAVRGQPGEAGERGLGQEQGFPGQALCPGCRASLPLGSPQGVASLGMLPGAVEGPALPVCAPPGPGHPGPLRGRDGMRLLLAASPGDSLPCTRCCCSGASKGLLALLTRGQAPGGVSPWPCPTCTGIPGC